MWPTSRNSSKDLVPFSHASQKTLLYVRRVQSMHLLYVMRYRPTLWVAAVAAAVHANDP